MKTALTAILAMLPIAPIGCSTITPGSIQTGVVFCVSDGLQGVVLADPSKKNEVITDVTTIATTINTVIIPQFQGQNSAALANGSITTFLTLLQSKLSNSKHGATIVGLIKMAEGLTPLLAETASPTTLMSPAVQADALAFFSGVSQGIAIFTGNSSLNPPVVTPPPSTPPPPTPVSPPPVPAHPK